MHGFLLENCYALTHQFQPTPRERGIEERELRDMIDDIIGKEEAERKKRGCECIKTVYYCCGISSCWSRFQFLVKSIQKEK